MGYIQLIWGKELQQRQWDNGHGTYGISKRGMIKDRNGNILAQSGSSETIAARPSQIKDPKVRCYFSTYLEMDEDKLYEKLSDTKSSFVWIKDK